MKFDELNKEINFGLENLDRIYQTILKFTEQKIEEDVRTSALTYECFGYYNAVEHLIIRLIKHFGLTAPSGQFSHRDILRLFKDFLASTKIDYDDDLIISIENLMAFRHVATKIYSFLIDWEKLEVIITLIRNQHHQIEQLILRILKTLEVEN